MKINRKDRKIEEKNKNTILLRKGARLRS